MSKISDYKCDICGKPATNLARDAVERPDDGSGFRNYKGGPIKFGCDEHRARGEMIAHPDPLCDLRAKMMQG